VRQLDENVDTAFQLAMNRGPLCAEPVIGMAYFLEEIELHPGDMDSSTSDSSLCSSEALANLDSRLPSALEMVKRPRTDHLGWTGRFP